MARKPVHKMKFSEMQASPHLCYYCARPVTFDAPPNITGHTASRDHIIPKYAGGSNYYKNLVMACHDCNCLKGNKTLEMFMEAIKHRRPAHISPVRLLVTISAIAALIIYRDKAGRTELCKRRKQTINPLPPYSGQLMQSEVI